MKIFKNLSLKKFIFLLPFFFISFAFSQTSPLVLISSFPTSTPISTTAKSVVFKITDTNHDAESINGVIYTLPSSAPWGKMYLGYDRYTKGFIFDGGWIFDTNIPQKAKIISSEITLTANTDNFRPRKLNGYWYGYAIGNPPDFINGSSKGRIADLYPKTSNYVYHSFNVVGSGQKINSPNLSNIIQEIVNRPDFNGRIGLTFKTNNFSNVWQSWIDYSDNPQNAAMLKITYEVSTTTPSYPPLSVSCSSSPDPATVNQNVTFTSSVSGGTGSYFYSWAGACTGTNSSCSKSFSSAGTYTANLIVLSGLETKSASCSVNVQAPQQTPLPTSTPISTTAKSVVFKITDTNHDAESINGVIYTLPSSAPWGKMYLGYDRYTKGFIFDGGWIFDTNIPQKAKIISSEITLTANTDNFRPRKLNGYWYGYAIGNPPDFINGSSKGRIADLYPKTSNYVYHSFNVVGSGQKINSPNLSNIIQEIVNRPDFNGRIGLTFKTNNFSNVWQSWIDYSDNPQNAAMLKITYEVSTTTPSYPPLSVSCSSSPDPATVNQNVTFTSSVSGGTGSYFYSWAGACTGTNSSCSKSFSSAGTYTANLIVLSGLETKSASCSVNVQAPQQTPLPTVDLKVNNSDSPITVYTSATFNLAWTSQNASSCLASGSWSGSKTTSGSQSISLSSAGTYTYTLTCTNSSGSTSDSVTVNVVSQSTPTPTSTLDTTPPSTPTNLSATAVSTSQINLSWTPSTDNVGVTGYRVERCQGSSCTNFVQIAIPSTASYSDTNLSANTTYRYRVRAVDAAGNLSSYSSIVNATTQSITTSTSTSTMPHDYFNALVARPDHWVSASLRDQAWLDAHYKGNTSMVGKWITYDPVNDTDPDRQDAAKVTIPPNNNSIPGQSQVYVPLGTKDGHRYLFTWDAYWTPGMLKANHNIQHQKTWQFSLQRTSFKFWLETKIGFSCHTSGGPRPPGCDPAVDIGAVYVRSYNTKWDGQSMTWTPQTADMLGPSTAGWDDQPLGPMPASFRLKPKVWTRFWWLFEQRANDWDRAWLWVADEQEGPILVVDGAQVSLPTTPNAIESWFLEYNTSSNHDGVRTVPLVSYVRNFVALRDPPADVTPLLLRPVSGAAPLPPLSGPSTRLRVLVGIQ